MKFLCFLLLINFILFLPRYIFGLPKNWNPLRTLFVRERIQKKILLFYFSKIIDPFRISLEYILIVFLCLLLGMNPKTLIVIFTILALLIFVFNIYVAIFTLLLHRTPVLKSDWGFIKNSVGFYKGYFLIIIAATLILLSLFSALFYHLHRYLLTMEFNPFYSLVFLFMVLVNGLYRIRKYDLVNYNYLYRTIFSVFIFAFKSNAYSQVYDEISFLSKEKIEKLNLFSDVKLKTKPNLHIISMESYGSILFKNKDTYDEVRLAMNKWARIFEQSDIHLCSSYAIPPLFASGTWYSYSTLLFGLMINDGTLHDVLFKKMKNFKTYESLFQFTRREGYTNYLLNGLKGEYDDVLDFEKAKRNLNYDKLLYNTDLEYTGQTLDFVKLQKCSPDQYTINKGLDLVQTSTNPYTLFFCTLNSHIDFCAPLKPVSDWKDLNKENFTFKTTLDEPLNREQRYSKSIKYTIDTIFETIQKRMKANDIFIVYGDHQPTMLTDEKYGYETPIHIFSRDKAFIMEWKQFGFSEGLLPKEGEDYLRFEGFYSAFVKCFNKVYGEDPDLEIPFLKKGTRLI